MSAFMFRPLAFANGVTVYEAELPEHMDQAAGMRLAESIRNQMSSGGLHFALGLSRVAFINSTSVRVFVELSDICRSKGGDLLLYAVPVKVRHILDMLGLAEALRIVANREVAINRLSGGAKAVAAPANLAPADDEPASIAPASDLLSLDRESGAFDDATLAAFGDDEGSAPQAAAEEAAAPPPPPPPPPAGRTIPSPGQARPMSPAPARPTSPAPAPAPARPMPPAPAPASPAPRQPAPQPARRLAEPAPKSEMAPPRESASAPPPVVAKPMTEPVSGPALADMKGEPVMIHRRDEAEKRAVSRAAAPGGGAAVGNMSPAADKERLKQGEAQRAEKDVLDIPVRGLMETRSAAVRYFSVMNPQRIYPLHVALSRMRVEAPVKADFKQVQSQEFKVEAGTLVEVEPVLPGCQVYPERQTVRVEGDIVEASFHVVPQVLGRITGAKVRILQHGRVLAETDMRIVVRTKAIVLVSGLASTIAPMANRLLQQSGLDFSQVGAQDPSYYNEVISRILEYVRPETMLGVGVAITLGLWLWVMPRRKQSMFDLRTESASAYLNRRVTEAREAKARGDQPGLRDALESIQALAQSNPGEQEAWLWLGRLELERNNKVQAAKYFGRAVEAGPLNAEDQKRFDQALNRA